MKKLAVASFLLVSFAAAAQALPPPQNVLQLSANGTVEVTQDLISISLATTREANDAAAVQAQLKSAVDAALAEVKRSAEAGQMDVRTGAFSVYPRYANTGKIAGWRGTAEVALEGRDFPRVTQAAARVTTMTVGNIGFGLSREQRAKVETDAQSAAIERFKVKAQELARGFGFTGYSLREVAVNSSDFAPGPRPRMMAQAVSSAESSPVPVEAGKTTVTVTVSGSVQLK
ncbi:MAG TPA: SIMPL domain-containing protein [Ramlibacter sp.]|nr:SIMPL domain-containing protein [Ramlibacter sp.]